jgi:D-sedoheptulose 7-phosphate isomerase
MMTESSDLSASPSTQMNMAEIHLAEFDMVDQYLRELSRMVDELSRDSVWSVINVLMAAWRAQSQVFILGNGGSAATASHMANDLNKYTIVPGKPRFKAIALTDNVPLMTAWGNDDAYENIFAEQLLNFVHPGDVVVAISASGNSPNVLKAVQLARQNQAVTIAFTGQSGGKLKDMVDFCVLAPSSHIGQQEDCHMILDHVIAHTLRSQIQKSS